VSRIEQSGKSSLRRPKLPTKGGSAPKKEEGGGGGGGGEEEEEKEEEEGGGGGGVIYPTDCLLVFCPVKLFICCDSSKCDKLFWGFLKDRNIQKHCSTCIKTV